MLQIRLNKGSSVDGNAGANSSLAETVTVACPDHLVLADLPVAKGLGYATAASTVKIVGRRSRRQLGERVHFCVRCDFPIAIYGRLSPCEHAFCLDRARSDSICYLCDERIQKIQTIKMMEGIFVCAAPHCLKSFLKKNEFESHIRGIHADLLQPNMKKEEVNEPQVSGSKQSSTLDTSLRGPSRPGFPPSSNPQLNDREDKTHDQQPPPRLVVQPKPPQHDNHPMGIDQSGQTWKQQPILDTQGGTQQGILPNFPQQLPGFPMPINSNLALLGPPSFGIPPFPVEGNPPFYGAPVPYEVGRSESASEAGSEEGSVLGVAPGPGGAINYPEGYPRPWSLGHANIPFEAMQGRQGILAAPQAMPPPPPPPGPPPPYLLQQQHGYFPVATSNDGNNYRWQSERHDGFGSSQD